MLTYQAMDTGVAELADGSEVKITAGEVVLKGERKYEVVLNDIAAQRANPGGRTPLFQKLDLGEEEPPAKAKAPLTRKST